MNWKLPPIEKVYEAFSVLADSRYEILSEGKAKVTSSAGDKHYSVSWTIDNEQNIIINSNDNASRWQGYTGYPIIAILMILNRIKYDKEIIGHFKSINWNDLNKKHKNNYARVVDLILSELDSKTAVNIRNEADRIYSQVRTLKLSKPTSKNS